MSLGFMVSQTLMNFEVLILISCKKIVYPQVHDLITESEETNPDGR